MRRARARAHLAFFMAWNENTKSCLSSGLWQVKQFFRLALSFTVLSALKAWYSHSPLQNRPRDTRCPNRACFSMTV